MKKILTLLFVTVISFLSTAQAATPTDADPFQVIVPNWQGGIEVTLEGLLMRADLSDIAYGTVLVPTAKPRTFTQTGTIENPDGDLNIWGMRIAIGYLFPNSGNDVQFAWTGLFRTTDSNSKSPAGGQFFGTEFGLILPPNGTTTLPSGYVINVTDSLASSTTKTQYNALDLDAGQYVDLGTRLELRFFGGVRAAQLISDITNYYSSQGTISNPTLPDFALTAATAEQDQLNSKYTGIGPRFGVDSSYQISHCFGVIGHFSAAFLIGEVESNTSNSASAIFNGTVSGAPFSQTFAVQYSNSLENVTRIVPNYDAKIGMDYTYVFENQALFSTEIGYQWINYVNAIDRIHNVITGASTFASSITTSNIGFDGPYVSLNYKV